MRSFEMAFIVLYHERSTNKLCMAGFDSIPKAREFAEANGGVFLRGEVAEVERK